MDKKNRMVVIYLPNGKEQKFTTSKAVSGPGSEYMLVDSIEREPNMVNVVYKQDGKVEGESYVGMPYNLHTW